MSDYTTFYGFSEDPFTLAPDPKFFFPAESHKEALASLLYGISHRKGFVLVLGETGMGKTTLIHHVASALGPKVKTVFIPQSRIPYEHLLKDVLLKLSVPVRRDVKGAMLHDLYYHLIQCLERDENVALIIDEAQDIQLDVIEEVRLLANLETSTSKLLQLVLVGEPELREKLRSDVIRQIKQRIVISCQINAMTESESRQYIDHRLGMVGSGSADVFTEEALSLLCRCAKGVPRDLNILCHNTLSVGQGLSERKISPAVVKMIQKEKDVLTNEGVQRLVSTVKSKLPRNMALAVLVMALIGLLIFFGKDYVPRILQTQPLQKTVEPAFKAKGKTPVPDPEAMRAASGTPQTPAPAASVRTESQPRDEIRIKNIVDVKQGANLHGLSYQYYKETNVLFMDYIMESNPDIANPNLIVVNQKIRMPEITESLLVMPASGGRFNVHLGTFLNLQEARRYRDQAASKGKDIAVVPRRVSKTETWYRVVAGPFVSRNEGVRFLEDMKHQGLLPFSYSRQGS